MNHHTESFWFIEYEEPDGRWGSVYYGYKLSYEDALKKLKFHRQMDRRAHSKNRKQHRLVCQTRQYFY
jgi:hypothetical protein